MSVARGDPLIHRPSSRAGPEAAGHSEDPGKEWAHKTHLDSLAQPPLCYVAKLGPRVGSSQLEVTQLADRKIPKSLPPACLPLLSGPMEGPKCSNLQGLAWGRPGRAGLAMRLHGRGAQHFFPALEGGAAPGTVPTFLPASP